MTSKIVEKGRKLCFVTIGATAGFDALIRAVLSGHFLQALREHHYTELRVQHGDDVAGVYKQRRNNAIATTTTHGIDIAGFSFNKKGLGQEMRDAKGTADGSQEGVVISHAGSGSILDALRISVPIIVVPNPELLDNHQLELAEELARQGYVVHGQLENLTEALHEAEILRRKENEWPPRSKQEDASGRGLIGVMDDEMGFVD